MALVKLEPKLVKLNLLAVDDSPVTIPDSKIVTAASELESVGFELADKYIDSDIDGM